MKNLALFDLDHTLLPIDSDHEWGEFLVRTGAVDPVEFKRRNDEFYAQYQAGTLDPVAYLEFALGTLARFPRKELDTMHARFMAEVIEPAILPRARELLRQHIDAGDVVAIITATNRYVTAPIARALGVEHLIAAVPEEDANGNLTGKLVGVPTSGAGKVTHTHAWLAQLGTPLGGFGRSHFYSDSHNDIPLLSVVTHPVATNPNAALATHATRLGWPLLHLFND
ncbi:HAD family hydrolase [Massilia antarctica]|uniref:histidinol-phosphatase n=1 Tax=Massilia antarctica TaxID=2765360 RepID=UPI0006BB6733|nr:HAD family hydrolase [Massilia sp. H27-R4]MCY0915996.1 HAD-IB family hydrolase [Massilia sp. H27-R4]CUI05616.1 Phosphoserine phosphatase [Janthinobacterium sp. CG23_2]CUU29402.1 Phosphoserine phosphatase [Janthinobacterium sp. CG23_2]